MSVIWHDLECGTYTEDLGLWRELAEAHGDPVLDVGAGTGRVALELARAGHRVTALDQDAELLAELAHRADGLPVDSVVADARHFELEQRFALCIVPMQTIQLLGAGEGRKAFLACARKHLAAGGVIAIAITEELETFEIEDGFPAPLPDICELDGVVYSSQPTAVRAGDHGFVLERRREVVGTGGSHTATRDVIHLDRVTATQLEREAAEVGLRRTGRATVPETRDYVGSEVVIVSG
jgi:SAM-dependent methyltransferase